MTPQTSVRSKSILQRITGPAQAISPSVWIAILGIAIPILIDCFDPSDGDEAIGYVARRYDASRADDRFGGYDRRLAKTTARQLKRAARKNRTRITWDQAREGAIRTLDDIREGDPQQTSLVIREHASFSLI